MNGVRVRFAPSPTGTLHVGSARTALYNFLFARHNDGVLALRIEDTDVKRSRVEHEQSIIRDLEWLGLRADEGPDLGGEYGPYRQSGRGRFYEAGVQGLLESDAAYYCFCTQERLEALKAEQLARGEMPKYDRLCLSLHPAAVAARLAAGEPATVRFKVPPGEVSFDDLIHGRLAFSSDVIGDFIIKRTDGGFAYNFAVVMDDVGMKITHVIRGEDHITNTARQLMLYGALGEPAPRYAHHSLIHGADGGKLSKRHGATSVGEFRQMGYLAGAIVNYLALLSWNPGEGREKLDLEELIAEFEIERLSRSPAIFDLDKLNWLNGLYIRELSAADLAEAVRPYLDREGIELAPGREEIVAAAIQANLVTLSDAPQYARIFVEDLDIAALSAEVAVTGEADTTSAVLEVAAEARAARAEEFLGLEEARDLLRAVANACKEKGIKGKSVYMPLRMALTGREQGPELFYLVAGLPREVVLARLQAAKALIEGREEG